MIKTKTKKLSIGEQALAKFANPQACLYERTQAPSGEHFFVVLVDGYFFTIRATRNIKRNPFIFSS